MPECSFVGKVVGYDHLLTDQEEDQVPLEGYKYLGGICNHIISKNIPQFLVFYYRSSGVRY